MSLCLEETTYSRDYKPRHFCFAFMGYIRSKSVTQVKKKKITFWCSFSNFLTLRGPQGWGAFICPSGSQWRQWSGFVLKAKAADQNTTCSVTLKVIPAHSVLIHTPDPRLSHHWWTVSAVASDVWGWPSCR